MCIFAGPVERVGNTNIYVGTDFHGRQFTAYQMKVDLKDGKTNAMILPVPGPAEDVNLIDLSGCPDLFDDLNALFPRDSETRGITKGYGGEENDSLVIEQVGTYKVSIAPTALDVSRASKDVFDLDSNTSRLLGETYSSDFCFVICQLDEGGKIHPMGYTHKMISVGRGHEFLFVPTKHDHGDGEFRPAWDHAIYYQGTPTGPVKEPGKSASSHRHNGNAILGERFVRALPQGITTFFFGNDMHQLSYQGRRDNVDLLIAA